MGIKLMTKTHFGFKTVDLEKKESLVQGVFSEVASKYDLMNDFMSFGLHHSWKRQLIEELSPAKEELLLDVAGGTGDISAMYLNYGGGGATVCDLNENMLEFGQQKLSEMNIKWVLGNAEQLPFEDNQFDHYAISFGIRNVTNIDKALKEAYRVLKVGGKFACLELSNVNIPILRRIYDLYSFKIIPKVGKIVTGSEDSYQYLVESVRKFPKAEQFKQMIEEAGFYGVNYIKLSFGVVAIHVGYKV